MVLGLFILVFAVSFLVAKNNNDDTMAANMGAFDPGYIMSDWQMGNYTSMNESQIQSFLKSKNSCYDTNTGKYTVGDKVGYFSEMSPPRTWHIKDGHFVCMADEVFNGGTAAHIIWQAAQDYRINPQVLLVLLEKEQSLVTDTFPHSQQYRSATGYGCPDTAPCSSQYYGLRNQIRKAAELFRTVLDGGWTNYPLGWNYVQYNPNTGCGGTMVNIRSRATSALYRYTPYQPNAAALGGWNDGCGAYGNMNFYKLFEDWFGGIKKERDWDDMETPRYLTTVRDTYYYDLATSSYTSDVLYGGQVKYYSRKLVTSNGEMCLRTNEDIRNNKNRCVLYSDLKESEWFWGGMETPRYMEKKEGAKIIDVRTRREVGAPGRYEYYDRRVGLPDGDMCLRIIGYNNNYCVLYSSLKEVSYEVYDMAEPRFMSQARGGVDIINPVTNKAIGKIGSGMVFYKKKIVLPTNEMCLLVDGYSNNGCVKYGDLSEVWVEMERPRNMKLNRESYKVDATNLRIDYSILLTFGMQRKFVMKRYMPDGNWCLQTEYDHDLGTNNCVRYKELDEI